ncbi:MAG: MNIO family bufferin maturase [Alphaproteobacteria bacterium]
MRPQRAPFCDAIAPVPARAGAGVKPDHYHDLLTSKPPLAFIEVHPENYMGAGGPPHAYLEAIAAHYPLSFHGVGLSLAGAEPLDQRHLACWRTLVDHYQPALVSEHIAWSRFGGVALHDLLPVPYTDESLRLVCDHIDQMQTALKRKILVENPSSYVSFAQSEIPEAEFMVEAARRSGCGLLLDVNNVYVSAGNHGFDTRKWLAKIPAELVGEIHLAGHSLIRDGDFQIRIDDHGSRTCAEVWTLYREIITRIGPRPTLIEWDTDVPELAVLCDEARRADDEASAAMESADAAAA